MCHAAVRSFRFLIALWDIVLSYDRIGTAIAKSSLGANSKTAASLQKLGDVTKTRRAPASKAVNKGKPFISAFERLHVTDAPEENQCDRLIHKCTSDQQTVWVSR
ncbi:uncharacterized protein BJ212DRAFT_794208 [Suillus subaureus]|uniref:Rab-GAP TBC domain-containing protein n=1 Tax=Suillus subaureus TaxID=48587 RepID=A0A9P7DYB4_9AGAM|nr:uncharacterized protein BJ212DRAFT_794208 [Suillus subaureus]KAG1806146.1 hypothetical protein BJ212DRAFT_794208 [Suillus subaureus]